MRSATTTARRLFVLGFAAALLAAFGCNGGSDPDALHCSDGVPAAPNAVSLGCGGATGGTTEKVDVVLRGPASGSTTLSGMNFDVTYDPSHLEFVPAASFTSPLFPDALIGVTLLDGQPGRVVVSIQNTGGALETVGSGRFHVLSLPFRRVPGTTFGPTQIMLENAEATHASPAIAFGSGVALSYR